MRLRVFSLAVALATFSTIAIELALTRVFSVTMYYHFAFMVISLALLGMAVAGVAVYVLPRVFRPEWALWQIALAMLLVAVTGALALWVALSRPVQLRNWDRQLGDLLLVYFASSLPFLCSGFAVTLAIAASGPNIGRVYAYDLIGAALGCLFVVPAISVLGAPGAILLAAAIAAVASALFVLAGRMPASNASRGAVGIAVLTAVALVYLAATEAGQARFGSARNPSKFLGEREVLFEAWNAFSHVTVAPAGADDHRWIFIDADAATRMWSGTVAEDGYAATRRIPEIRVASLAYAIRHEGTALIIGPGGGTDVMSALYYGVPRVVGVEVNPIIVDTIMGREFADYTGHLYADPRVEIVVDEGRSYISRSTRRYATIQATLVDTWAASSSGAFTLSENNIYTVEALEEFFAHLTDDGIVTVTRWYDASDPKEFLRLVALARAALERRGVDRASVARHFFLATDGQRRGTMLASVAPFTDDDLAVLTDVARREQLRILYAPAAGAAGGAARGGATGDEDAFVASFLEAPDAAAFLAALPYDASPPTDDRPFFFYTVPPDSVLSMFAKDKRGELHNLGVVILLTVLGLSVLLTVVFVLAPLLLLRREALASARGPKLRLLVYFLMLGLGFILVEIGLMQRFVLFLGHPIYALVVVLAVLLAASGAGSAMSGLLTRRWTGPEIIVRAGGILAAILVLYAIGLTWTFHQLLHLPLIGRVIVAAILVALPGLLMGVLLPTGVRAVRAVSADIVPWAWGLNGATSVVGSVLAIFLSMNLGFTAALLVGLAAYIVGFVAFPRATTEN